MSSRLHNETSNNPVMLPLKFFKLLLVTGCISCYYATQNSHNVTWVWTLHTCRWMLHYSCM